jgi:ubiquinol-cytochrome c reductase cytochrome b subunit
LLHQNGSNNPLGLTSNGDKIPFHPYYTFKDIVGFFLLFFILSYFIFYIPNFLSHPDNYIAANPMVTPPHIQPEFYFLPFYAILRSIPDKLLGVIAMFIAIFILFFVPYLDISRIRGSAFRPLYKFLFWIFVANFFILGWIGAKPVEDPYIVIGQLSTIFYFSYFLFFIPLIGFIENSSIYDTF